MPDINTEYTENSEPLTEVPIVPPAYADPLPTYNNTLEFDGSDMIIRGAKDSQHLRIMNMEETLDLLYISDPEKTGECLFFHKGSLTGPLVFTIERIDSKRTFKITDHRTGDKIVIRKYAYNLGKKHQFRLPNGTYYSWKTDHDTSKLVQYPGKEVVARMNAMATVQTNIFAQTGNNIKFTMTVKDSELYHFAWLTGFALNWEACKRANL